MKHAKHEKRLSFPKWAMPNQRIETQDSGKLNDRRALALMNGKRISNIGKNNGPLKHSVPAQNNSTQFRLQKHSCLSDPAGRDALAIWSHNYHPEPKAPSRRDKHREEVRQAHFR